MYIKFRGIAVGFWKRLQFYIMLLGKCHWGDICARTWNTCTFQLAQLLLHCFSIVFLTLLQMHTCIYELFVLFFFKFYFIFKLYNIVLVLPNIEMNPPQVYPCSPSWTLLPPPSPYHPSGSSQCTSPNHPVSCIEPGLATCFIHDIIHVKTTSPTIKWFIKCTSLSGSLTYSFRNN